MTDEEKAIREVLANIDRQEPRIDCNQCRSYEMCGYNPSIEQECIFVHNQKMRDWLARKEKWLNRLSEVYNGEASS